MRPTRTIAERFWLKVAKSDTCWLWTGSVDRKGYGKIGSGGNRGKTLIATRVSWWLATGEWPTLFVCHTCDVPSCVNPLHLFEGTRQDNMRDCSTKGRLNHFRSLTDDQAASVRERLSRKERIYAIAQSLGVSVSVISCVKSNRGCYKI